MPDHDIIQLDEENRKTQDMLRHIQTNNTPVVYDFIHMFLSTNHGKLFDIWMAKLLHMLSGDAPVESVVPFTSHENILTACVQIQSK